MPDSFSHSIEQLPYVAIWTRDLDLGERAGRIMTASTIRQIMKDNRDYSEIRMAVNLRRAVVRVLSGALTLRFMPLQCALFWPPVEIEAPPHRQSPPVFYLDGIRAFGVLRSIRRKWPDARIVCDFDDLMSRRMKNWRKSGVGVSLGFIENRVPLWIAHWLRSGLLVRLLLIYEEFALRRAEREALRLSDLVTLVSEADATVLRADTKPELHARIIVIPPPAQLQVATFEPNDKLRFAFIGSDKLAQNRMTIDYLLSLWQKAHISAELHIFGHQSAAWSSVPHVTFHGFVDDLRSVYDGATVLLAPSFIPGGVKTKVLEAFSFAAPVIGNSITFEGLPLRDYPLALDDDDALKRLILDPLSELATLHRAASVGRRLVEELASSFPHRWTEVFEGVRRG